MKTFLRYVVISILGLAFLLLEMYLIGTYDSWKNTFAYLGALFCFMVFLVALMWALLDDDEAEKDPQDG